jgi:hypothetical protein
LFQNVSAAIKASSSPSRCFTLATSKKPPQMGDLRSRGIQLRFDDVEHSTARLGQPFGGCKHVDDRARRTGLKKAVFVEKVALSCGP